MSAAPHLLRCKAILSPPGIHRQPQRRLERSIRSQHDAGQPRIDSADRRRRKSRCTIGPCRYRTSRLNNCSPFTRRSTHAGCFAPLSRIPCRYCDGWASSSRPVAACPRRQDLSKAARRMGGAKRYPSIIVREDDGFRACSTHPTPRYHPFSKRGANFLALSSAPFGA